MKDGIAAHRPIGIFDSGVGGLTVLRALHRRMPGEAFLYLGIAVGPLFCSLAHR